MIRDMALSAGGLLSRKIGGPIKGVPKLLGSPHEFRRYGQSGAAMSSLLPHLTTIVETSPSCARCTLTTSTTPRRKSS